MSSNSKIGLDSLKFMTRYQQSFHKENTSQTNPHSSSINTQNGKISYMFYRFLSNQNILPSVIPVMPPKSIQLLTTSLLEIFKSKITIPSPASIRNDVLSGNR